MNPMTPLLLVGPPGCGKTLWARNAARDLNDSLPLKTGAIYQLAGLRYESATPFRAPHHTISTRAMIGLVRRNGLWMPGEMALAHGGVLFLDEVTEFSRGALDLVVRAIPTATFQLISATNPCPCGQRRPACVCTQTQINRYLGRIPKELRVEEKYL